MYKYRKRSMEFIFFYLPDDGFTVVRSFGKSGGWNTLIDDFTLRQTNGIVHNQGYVLMYKQVIHDKIWEATYF